MAADADGMAGTCLNHSQWKCRRLSYPLIQFGVILPSQSLHTGPGLIHAHVCDRWDGRSSLIQGGEGSMVAGVVGVGVWECGSVGVWECGVCVCVCVSVM
jgi:hypothetical protein